MKNGTFVFMTICLVVPALCGGDQTDLCAEEISLHPIGNSSFTQEVPKFGKFGRAVVEMAQVRPPEDAFLSILIAVKGMSGRRLRTVQMDFLEVRGQNYFVRMFVDGRENFFEYSAMEDRVMYWWGPDGRPEAFDKGITVCEGTGIWTCAVQAGLWGMVNPLAGAAAGIACGIGFAVACN